MNFWRISGIFLRNFYLIRQSWHRGLSLFYWTTLELFLWGFITVWLQQISAPDLKLNFVLFFLGALIFWDLFTRVQQTVTVSFLEDVWTRNIMNIFIAPITIREFFLGLMLLSIAQSLVAFFFAFFLAYLLYGLNIAALGFYLLPFIFNIFLFGWALGIFIVGLLVRFGPSIDIFAWSVPVLFQPLSAVFYPLDVLPAFLQKIAFFLPTAHLFEGMRGVLAGHAPPFNEIILTTALNFVYFAIAVLFFAWMLRVARRRGILSRFTTD